MYTSCEFQKENTLLIDKEFQGIEGVGMVRDDRDQPIQNKSLRGECPATPPAVYNEPGKIRFSKSIVVLLE